MTVAMDETQHNNAMPWCLVSHFINYYAECYYAECHYAECHYAECRYAECHYDECHYSECHYAECHYAECHYAECHYAECCGAIFPIVLLCWAYKNNLSLCLRWCLTFLSAFTESIS